MLFNLVGKYLELIVEFECEVFIILSPWEAAWPSGLGVWI